MSDVFLHVLNTSFSATWVVLAVILARMLLKKAPRSMVCCLWSLVGLRLLIGGRLESSVSLIPSAEIIPPQSLLDTAPAIDSGVPLIDRLVNPVYTEALRPMVGASINPLQVWIGVFAALWVLGMIAMALWALWSAYRVRRQLGESLRVDENVFLCDRVESPMIFGFLRPKIYLPSNLDDAAKAHVIAHENAHIARRDHWWKPLAFALLTVNWFNPAIWLAYILLCRDIEMACDERVVAGMTLSEKKAYSSVLLRCSVKARYVTACPLAFGEVGVKERVKSVLSYKKPAFWIVAAAVILTAVLAAGLLTSPVEKISEIRYNGGVYVLFNADYSFLPAEESVGTLRNILHNTSEHPAEDFQGTNLDESLTGRPLYLEEDQLYLVKHDGSCLAFRLEQTNRLGLSLSVSDVTPHGLTLHCVQDGTSVAEVWTGSQWWVERLEDGQWVHAFPGDETAWTTEAYVIPIGGTKDFHVGWTYFVPSLEPGTYRIAKSFYASLTPVTVLSPDPETVSQIYYAEFTLE